MRTWSIAKGLCSVLCGDLDGKEIQRRGDIWWYTCFYAIFSNHPTLTLSHRVQKSVLYTCVSFAVSHIRWSYHLSKFHIYALKVKSLSRGQLFVTPWTVAHQAPLPMGFSRQEYWSELPFIEMINPVFMACSPPGCIVKGRAWEDPQQNFQF